MCKFCHNFRKFFRKSMDGVLDRRYRRYFLVVWTILCLILVISFVVLSEQLYLHNQIWLFSYSAFLWMVVIAMIVVLKRRTTHWKKRLQERALLEGHVHVPPWVEHVSWPQGSTWKMPDSSSRQTQASNPKAKLAFLFNVKDALPFDELWQKFFESHEEQFFAVVICTGKDAPPNLNLSFPATIVENVSATNYGAAVPAQQQLIKKALEDRDVQGAVLLSAHCVPIKCFADVHKQLLGPDRGPHGSRGRSILNFESRLFEKCSHWHYQTREFMEKYIEHKVDLSQGEEHAAEPIVNEFLPFCLRRHRRSKARFESAGNTDYTARLRTPDFEETFQLNLHHSQEEFYPPAIAIRYSLPCRHGIVTLDVWDKRSNILMTGVDFDRTARGPPESPLTFTALTRDFLASIADTEICFLRKVIKTEETLSVLMEKCTERSQDGAEP